MAKAVTVKRSVQRQFSTESVTLTLTPEEAYTLVAVLESIGGDPDTSPRRYSNSVCAALRAAGIVSPFAFEDKSKYVERNNFAIYFKDGSVNKFLDMAVSKDNKPD